LGFTRGVDKYFIESETEAFAELLKNRNNKTLTFFHFGGIHYPYGFHKLKFAEVDYPKKVNSLECEFNISTKINNSDMLDESYRSPEDKILLLRYKNIIDTLWNDGKYNDLHKMYLEGINYFLEHRFNHFIKKIIDFVDNSNSLLIVFADHGENWAVDSRGHSNSISDAALRVPVIFYGKGVAKNTVVSKLIRTIDILPTISQHSSILPKNIDGLPIDLAKPGSSIDSREAFAQVWRVGDRLKIYNHQQQILKNKKMTKPLNTKLEKEAVYFGELSVSLEYSSDGKIKKETICKNTGKHLIPTQTDSKNIKILKDKLKKYNLMKHDGSGKIDEIANTIAADLKLLGYRI
jgi:hypothetical protein